MSRKVIGFVLFLIVSIGGGAIGYFLNQNILIMIGAGLIGIYLWASVYVVSQWDRAVILRLGKFSGLKGPGFFGIIPLIDTVANFIDTRIITTPFTAEQTLTTDGVPVDVDAVLFWKVVDAKQSALEVEDYNQATTWSAQTALREVIGRTSLKEVLSNREKLDEMLRQIIMERTKAWGIEIMTVEIRDIVIPVALQDAMSMQAQAQRELESRVILGNSEVMIAEQFEEASKRYVNNPTALHLRAMNMLYEALKERGALVIVPSTAVETMGLGTLTGLTSLSKEFLQQAGVDKPTSPVSK